MALGRQQTYLTALVHTVCITCILYTSLFLLSHNSFLWPPCVADADIIFCSCGFYLLLLLSSFLSSPNLIGRRLNVYHTWCGLSANLECRSEMCCMRLCKKRHLRTIAQVCLATSLQLRHVSTIRKRLVKQQYLLQMSPQYGELRPICG